MEQISTSSFHPLKSLEEMGPEDCKLDHIQTISITGILKDLDDNVISNAQVRIYGEAGDNLLSETKTDTNGRYSISAILANGLYFVAFSNGYTEARYKRVFLANPMVQLDGYLRIKSLPPIVTGMPLPTMR